MMTRFFRQHYLAEAGAPIKTLDETIKGGMFHPTIRQRLERAQTNDAAGDDGPGCKTNRERPVSHSHVGIWILQPIRELATASQHWSTNTNKHQNKYLSSSLRDHPCLQKGSNRTLRFSGSSTQLH